MRREAGWAGSEEGGFGLRELETAEGRGEVGAARGGGIMARGMGG